jgi:hypothetical protein
MQVIWLVLTLLAVDLAALLFAADTRPGLEHTRRPRLLRAGTGRPRARRAIGG